MARSAHRTDRRGIKRGERVHGEFRGSPGGAFAAVYELVRQVPRGRVVSYGQVSKLLAQRLSPAAVGWALHGCPVDVPWQRVVNARGGCSTERLGDLPPGLQRQLLEQEGVVFRADGTLDLAQYRWEASGHSSRGERP